MGEEATKRPGPYAQDPSRKPPTKEEREDEYPTEKKPVGDTFKRSPGKKTAR